MKTPALVCALALVAANAAGQCLSIHRSPVGTDLQLGDDALAVVSLPFAFPYAGVNYNKLTIDSNGVVRFGDCSQVSPSDPSPSESELRNDPFAAIALMWDDWDPSSAGPGGGVFYEADSSRASVVWKNLPAHGGGPGLLNGEVALMPDGTIYLHYEPDCAMQSVDFLLVGMSRGHDAPTNTFDPNNNVAVADATGYYMFAPGLNHFDLNGWTFMCSPTGPLSYDLSKAFPGPCAQPQHLPPLSAAPVAVGVGCPAANPMVHTAGQAKIGCPWHLSSTVPDAHSFFGLFVIGLSSPGISLDHLGMLGCYQWATDELSYFPSYFNPGEPLQRTFQIPYDPVFGQEIFTQAAAWSTLTPFGVITSNGVQHQLGL